MVHGYNVYNSQVIMITIRQIEAYWQSCKNQILISNNIMLWTRTPSLADEIRSDIAQNRNWCLVRLPTHGLLSVLPKSELYRLHHEEDFVHVSATPRSERWDDTIAAIFDAFLFLGEIPHLPHRLDFPSVPIAGYSTVVQAQNSAQGEDYHVRIPAASGVPLGYALRR